MIQPSKNDLGRWVYRATENGRQGGRLLKFNPKQPVASVVFECWMWDKWNRFPTVMVPFEQLWWPEWLDMSITM